MSLAGDRVSYLGTVTESAVRPLHGSLCAACAPAGFRGRERSRGGRTPRSTLESAARQTGAPVRTGFQMLGVVHSLAIWFLFVFLFK